MYRPQLRGGAIVDSTGLLDLEKTTFSYDLQSMNRFVNLYYPLLNDPTVNEYVSLGTFVYGTSLATSWNPPSPGTMLPTAPVNSWFSIPRFRFNMTNRQGELIHSRVAALASVPSISSLRFRIRGVSSPEAAEFQVAAFSALFFRDGIGDWAALGTATQLEFQTITILGTPIGAPIQGNEYLVEWFSPTMSSGLSTISFVQLQSTVQGYLQRISTSNEQISSNQQQQSTNRQEIQVSSLLSSSYESAKQQANTNKTISAGIHSAAITVYDQAVSTLSALTRAFSSQVIQTNTGISLINASTTVAQSELNYFQPIYNSAIGQQQLDATSYSTLIYRRIGYEKTLSTASSIRMETDRLLSSVALTRSADLVYSTLANMRLHDLGPADLVALPSLPESPFIDTSHLLTLYSCSKQLFTAQEDVLRKESTVIGISSIRRQMATEVERVRVSTGTLRSSVSTLDVAHDSLTAQYNSSLTEFYASKELYEIYSTSTMYAKAITNEEIARSTLSRLQENLAILENSLGLFTAGNPAEGSSLYDSRLSQSSGTVPMVGGATQSDVELAITTQQQLITAVQSVLAERAATRRTLETEVIDRKDAYSAQTDYIYSTTVIQLALNAYSTAVETATTHRSTIGGIQTLVNLSTSQRILSTMIDSLVQSTIDASTTRGKSRQQQLDDYINPRRSEQMAILTDISRIQQQQDEVSASKLAIERRITEVKNALKDEACAYATLSTTYAGLSETASTAATFLAIEYVRPQALIIPSTVIQCAVPSQAGGADSSGAITDATLAALYAKQNISLDTFASAISSYTAYYNDLRGGDLAWAETTIVELSTIVLREISKRKLDLVVSPVTKIQTDAVLAGLRAFRDTEMRAILENFAAETAEFNRYIEAKRIYDQQSVFRKTPGTEPATISLEEFEAVKTTYDISVQACNYYIGRRRELFGALMTRYNAISSSIDSQVRQPIYEPVILALSTGTRTIPPRLPLVMNYSTISPRPIHFIAGGLAMPSLLQCDPSTSLRVAVVNRSTPGIPTTTQDTRPCGERTRWIELKHPTGTLELRQVMAIDKTGANVAFGTTPLLNQAVSTELRRLTNGASYSPALLLANGDYVYRGSGTLRIPFDRSVELTAIKLYKQPESAYQLNGIVITCSSGQTFTAGYSADEVTVDLRQSIAPESCPIVYMARRRGVCGVLARYIQVAFLPGDDPVDPNRYLAFSQLTVLDSSGTNLALSIVSATVILNGMMSIHDTSGKHIREFLMSGDYSLKPLVAALRFPMTSVLILDLGREADIVAVELYNVIAGTLSPYLAGNTVTLLNQEQIAVDTAVTVSAGPRDTLDFRHTGDCPIALAWPPSYGEAGFKARYLRLSRRTALSVKVCRVINRNGKNIAFGCAVTPSGPVINAMSIVSHGLSATETTLSGTGSVSLLIDLGYTTEVCGVVIEGSQIDGASIALLETPTVPSILGQNARQLGPGTAHTLDFRYDPAVSPYPVQEDSKTRSYKTATFGIFTQHILIESRANDIGVESVKVVEATGKEVIALDSPIIATESLSGMSMTRLSFSRQWEITAVRLPSGLGNRLVILRDCNATPVALNYATEGGADFRIGDGPLAPYPYSTGPHQQGVRCRYIKVIARDDKTPLYLSQIIAVNACGRNVAQDKESYATSSAPQSSAARVVDGVYERQMEDLNDRPTLYANYRARPASASFQSGIGANTYWIVDLGRFIDSSTEQQTPSTKCQNQISVNACQDMTAANFSYLHEINCVILVAPLDRRRESAGVVVQLLDDAGQLVGIQKVSPIVNIFGIDFLDFRLDITFPLAQALTAPPPRIIKTGFIGTTPYGIEIQYVRLEAKDPTKPFLLSQLFVLDLNGRNVALYKPTMSSATPDVSHRMVDGTYFTKPVAAAIEIPPTLGLQFAEVNLTCPQAITKVFMISANSGDTAADDAKFNNIKVKLLNSSRDVVLVQSSKSVVVSKDLILPTAGVNISKAFFQRKVDEDMVPAGPKPDPDAPAPRATLPETKDPELDLRTPLVRGTSVHAGVMASYVRILNPGTYIQLSQVMVFDASLNNLGRLMPASAVFATHALPGRQPERAIDGTGGYFHQPRAEPDCFISEKKPYEYWQLRLGSPKEIIGLKYIPPLSNRSRSRGLRFQLLDSNQNVCAQYVVEGPNFSELWVDFRMRRTVMNPIQELCMPKMEIVHEITGAPTGICQDEHGAVYVADFREHRILRFTITEGAAAPSTTVYGTWRQPGTGAGQLNSPMGLFYDTGSQRLYIADHGNNRVIECSLQQGQLSFIQAFPVTSPYAITSTGRTLLVSEHTASGRVVDLRTGQPYITNLSFPAGLERVLTPTGEWVLYVATSGSSVVFCYTLSPLIWNPRQTIGSGRALATKMVAAPRRDMPLIYPTAITADPATSVMFIVDSLGNKVYSMPRDPAPTIPATVSLLAGNGQAGKDAQIGLPAIQGTLDTPLFCIIHNQTGDLIITELGSRSIRRVRLSMLTDTTKSAAPDKVKPSILPTTTLPGEEVGLPTVVTVQRMGDANDPETIREFAASSRVFSV